MTPPTESEIRPSVLHEMRVHAAREAAAELERHERHAAMAASGIRIQTQIDGLNVADGTVAAPGSTIKGSVNWQVVVTGTSVERVEFRVDANTAHPNGVLPLSVEHYVPWQFNGDPDGRLDTSKLGDGVHKLGVRVFTYGEKKPVASAACWVRVDNSAAPPPPPPPPPPVTGQAGRVGFCMYATSQADKYDLSPVPTAAQKAWMVAHWNRMIEYVDQIASWHPGGWKYLDMMAIYTSSVEASQHPDWILKDSSGNRVTFYSSVQYAADIGNPSYQDYKASQVRAIQAAGHRGVHCDDVNLDRVVVPSAIDPRTGQPFTFDNWRRYFADMMVKVRAACPPPFEILHNSLWWADLNNPDVVRQIKAADFFELERGFNDSNYTSASIDQVMAFVDRLHSWGVHANHLSEASGSQAAMFNFCCALLCSAGGDYHYANTTWQPDSWNAAWDRDLGAAKGPRYKLSDGRLRRDFDGGVVTVDPVAKVGTIT